MFARIDKLLNENKIVAFIKGTKEEPKCKFSRQFVEIMNEQNVAFFDVDVITDPDNVRQWIKVYSGWKTLPQLFINKELIGGLDIVKELISEGEFADMIPKECKTNDPKAEMESIIAEEDIILVKTSDKVYKSDANEYSKQAEKHLQLKSLIFRSYDVETKPELIPILNQITGDKALPILFFNQKVYKNGLELMEYAQKENLTKDFEQKYFRQDIFAQIKSLINSAPVLIFMKGTPEDPQCGFSRTFISLINKFNIEYKTFDILKDYLIREKLKEYSNWKTYPQLYIKGELIGGLDIVKEMIEEGEFEDMIAEYKKK